MTTATANELQEAILEAYQLAEGDRKAAVEALRERWDSDKAFRRAVEYDVVSEGFGALVSHFTSNLRVSTAGQGERDDDSVIATLLRSSGLRGASRAGGAHVEKMAAAIYLYPLYGGQPIGAACKPDILKSVEQYQKQADGNQREASRQQRVADQLPNDTALVAETIDAETLSLLLNGNNKK